MRTVEPGRRPPSAGQSRSRQEEPRDPQHEPPRWDYWLYGTVVVAVILAALGWLSPGFRHEIKLSLGRQPTPYTQLGFTSAATLPATAIRGASIPLSFAVTNDEGKQVSYQYVVASGTGTKLAPLTSASKVVAAGATWDVRITVVPKCVQSACRIQVSLPKQSESIDMLLTLQNPSAKKSTKGK